MVKRTTSRSKVSDPAAPARPKPKRPRAAVKNASTAAQAADPSVEDIRRRAYERYLERGANHGQHFDDWLEAERELRTKN